MAQSQWAAGSATAMTILARLLLTLVFLMAFASKVLMFAMTADSIAAAGFPLPSLLAACAATLELAILIALVTAPTSRK